MSVSIAGSSEVGKEPEGGETHDVHYTRTLAYMLKKTAITVAIE